MRDTTISLSHPAAAPAKAADYVLLLKPRVMSLVVFTGFTGLLCAETPMNPILAVIAVLCIVVFANVEFFVSRIFCK